MSICKNFVKLSALCGLNFDFCDLNDLSDFCELCALVVKKVRILK
jgi:hypothetical protein